MIWSALLLTLGPFAELGTRAGVSIKTFSRAINGQGEISRATPQLVLTRGLVSGTTYFIVVDGEPQAGYEYTLEIQQRD